MITSIQTIVVAVVQNAKGEILLLKRVHHNDERFHGKWQLPGDSMNIGETMKQAVTRELYEETRLKPTMIHQLSRVYDSIRNDFQGIIIPFFVKVNTDQVTLNSENSAYQWLPLHKAYNEDLLLQTREILTLAATFNG